MVARVKLTLGSGNIRVDEDRDPALHECHFCSSHAGLRYVRFNAGTLVGAANNGHSQVWIRACTVCLRAFARAILHEVLNA